MRQCTSEVKAYLHQHLSVDVQGGGGVAVSVLGLVGELVRTELLLVIVCVLVYACVLYMLSLTSNYKYFMYFLTYI